MLLFPLENTDETRSPPGGPHCMLNYMEQEVLASWKCLFHSDIWSLAMTLTQLLNSTVHFSNKIMDLHLAPGSPCAAGRHSCSDSPIAEDVGNRAGCTSKGSKG